ncbi:MAG: hypothetical protein QF921_04075 [Pseudomonadales bacterium]|nr:hypothetical protein [Pseudomonadales bacterium]MDP6472254.1 hypothetical protein [Pseudomonadales bacterium]MDP6826494.1 hypothetical protein [Pseudomonadales bacterium]MDP6970679.1 hypothetical protein [Pseudomonadales bacterium]
MTSSTDHSQEDVRVSILWKAFCFAHAAEQEAYLKGTDNLTPRRIVEIFQSDLRHRGVRINPPEDLDGTHTWVREVMDIYTPQGA